MVRIVMDVESACAANLAQWIAYCVDFSLHRWAYPMFCHLYVKGSPKEPKILFLRNEEKKLFRVLEQMMEDEKYEWEILNILWIWSNIKIGSVYY